MPAYVVVDIEVVDPEGYKEYVKIAPATAAKYGGKNETLEGDWQAKSLVILEFADMEQAKKRLNSEEYAPARAMRHKYAKTNMVVAEGA